MRTLVFVRFVRHSHRKAVADFERALELSPENVDIHYNLGLVYTEMGSYEKAQEAFAKVLLLKPSDRSAQQQIEKLQKKAGPPAGQER